MLPQGNYPPIVHGEMTFQEILSVLDRVDSGDFEITDNERRTLRDQLLKEVDSVRRTIDEYKGLVSRHKKYEKEHKKRWLLYKNRIRNLSRDIAAAMRATGFSKAAGEEWIVSLRKSEVVDIAAKADEGFYSIYPSLIKIRYVWSKTAIKEAVKSGIILPFAAVRDSFSPIFKPNSRIK